MIKNITKKEIISKKEKLCKSYLSKAIGLMFSKKKKLILIFKEEEIIPLHMLFVFFSIDVLFVNKNKQIVEIKRNLKPFSFYTPKNKAKYIIEFPAGSVKNCELGDKIELTSP